MQKENENNKRRHSKLDLESRLYANNEMLNQVQHDDTYFNNNSVFTRPSSFPSPRRTGGVGNVGAALYPRTLRAARHSGMTNAASAPTNPSLVTPQGFYAGYSEDKRGFTLIELLVVVLIIGILASVALPQYNIAVAKTRFSTYRTLTESLVKAAENYHLSTGEWPDSFNVLDVDLPSGMTKNATGTKVYNNTIYCELKKPLKDSNYGQIRCADKENYTLAYTHLFANPDGKPYLQFSCSANAAFKAVCTSLGGKPTASTGDIYNYRLPGSQGY